MKRKPTAVIGVGNLLMTDEGIGCHAISYLQEKDLPEEIELIDAGSGGLSVLYMIEDRNRVVIIDCADFGGKPGSIKVLDPNELDFEENKMVSLHGSELLQTIALAKLAHNYPRKLHIIGIQPHTIAQGMEPTAVVRNALPEIYDLVLKMTGNPSFLSRP